MRLNPGSVLLLAGPAPLCLQVCPPETPLPVPSTVPEEVRARGKGRLCSWTSVDAVPVLPAFFLLYSRGSLLPLWSETAHTVHNQSASTEHLLYAQSCASCCPNPDSTVGNKLGMWPLSITGLIHHGQYHRANASRWCWMMRPVLGELKHPVGGVGQPTRSERFRQACSECPQSQD